jgi:hypothetical protein
MLIFVIIALWYSMFGVSEYQEIVQEFMEAPFSSDDITENNLSNNGRF